MDEHSSIVGGSTAGRRLNCPGSFQAEQALPPGIDIESEYAAEGTAMHAVMARLMADRQRAEASDLDFDGTGERYVGEFFHDRTLTGDHIDTMIGPALAYLAALERKYGDGFYVVGIEDRVRFPGVPSAFGTCDLILASASHVLHVDWKFGAGVGVAALYPSEHGDLVNPQLLFYATAAFATLPKLYRNRKKLAVAIIQPRNEVEPLSHTEVSRKELKWFQEDIENAVDAAWQRNPVRKKGEHCRWAPCKTTCPLWTGPLLDLSKLGVVTQQPKDVDARKPTPYGEYLARAKVLVDLLTLYKKEIDEQMHTFMDNGGLIPGWRLKAKVKNRQWIDPAEVEKKLKKLGFKKDEIWQSKLATFQSADATAKRLNVTIPDELRVAPLSTETTIAPTDDPAPVVDRAKAIDNFRAALRLLSAPSGAEGLASSKQETGS